MTDSILPADLDQLLGSGAAVRVFDVRRESDRVQVEYPIPGAEWRDPERVAQWCGDIGNTEEVIVYCVHGHHVSQSTRDALRRGGNRARIIAGGIEAWCAYAKGNQRAIRQTN